MIENKRNEIKVGEDGVAELQDKPQSVKPFDLMSMALMDEPYNWTVEQVDSLIESIAYVKECISETKPTLKIKCAKRKRKHDTHTEEEEDEEIIVAPKRRHLAAAYENEMDTKDIEAGRSKPLFPFVRAFEPVKIELPKL